MSEGSLNERQLRSLGLSADAEKGFRCLVWRPGIEASGMAQELGWSLKRTEQAVKELVKLALIRYSWEYPGQLYVVSPETGLIPLLTQQELKLHDWQKEVMSSRAAIERFAAEFDRRAAATGYAGAERLVGIDNVRFRLESLIGAVDTELMSFSSGGPQSEGSLTAARPLDAAMLDRGVQIRAVYLESLVNDVKTARYVDWLHECGARIRTASTLPLRMLIADRRAALVPLNVDDSSQGALLIRDAGIVAALSALFEMIWGQSVAYGENRRDTDEAGLTRQERAILALLAEGHTDDVVARRLGVSVRTCRRMTAELMIRLEAHSRFQAGVKAMEAGWIRGYDQLAPAPGEDAGPV